ncbi:sugar phosphate isomerase/epimerase family protein [Petrocella sp. FN5]|uniref:sugar phosphate isomerase/epimerase family protein n=1 Tax=Petrocella sp. FN5 TaxID=3032002 RepID=UPI0023DB3FAC|nr:sugar phosphate isomerase/epimerase [Petrocella sp. FN5]MDF1616076.1 sugar phosphate isomerase/epimerase [Petrocella sp. FN5]
MKLSVFTVPYSGLSLEETLKKLSAMGVQAVELGAGGYPGNAHLNAKALLADDEKVQAVKALVKKYNIEIAAISCHGNPVHPDATIAKDFHDQFIDAVLLAEKLEVQTVITFSGCPGDSEGSKYPNWVTCPWPDDFGTILDYQWNEVLIPYWKDTVDFAKQHNVNKIALEMHPGFCVYNPETLLRLREAVGDVIGANFDPSHLFWQGINPVSAIKALKGAIYHFHAKDTKIDERNVGINGVLDNKNYGDVLGRSWVFRTVGYGHDQEIWNDMISMLKAVKYDGPISIEHEDALMSIDEGLSKAIEFLKEVIIFETPTSMWWA